MKERRKQLRAGERLKWPFNLSQFNSNKLSLYLTQVHSKSETLPTGHCEFTVKTEQKKQHKMCYSSSISRANRNQVHFSAADSQYLGNNYCVLQGKSLTAST